MLKWLQLQLFKPMYPIFQGLPSPGLMAVNQVLTPFKSESSTFFSTSLDSKPRVGYCQKPLTIGSDSGPILTRWRM